MPVECLTSVVSEKACVKLIKRNIEGYEHEWAQFSNKHKKFMQKSIIIISNAMNVLNIYAIAC